MLFCRYRMIPQSAPTSSFLKPQSPHLHIDRARRPWCEQESPPERLEEIRGKIAAREREQTHAIAAKLEQQHAIDKTQADAESKANLELERRQGAAREAAAREEARKAAETAAAVSAQREILDKAKDDAINAEKANVFDENQELSNKVNELQRALEKVTNEERGEGAEIDLFEALKKEFPDDRIEHIGKKGRSGS